MAAIYFFFVKPGLDTTTHAIDSISEPIKEAQRQAEEAQQQLQQQQNQGDAHGTQVQINKLQKCVQRAGQNVNALEACASKFGP